MGRNVLRIAGLAAFLFALHVPAAHADTRWSFHVGVGTPYPPVVVAPRPYVAAPYVYGDDYYWEPAYRVRSGFGYRWVPGRWVRRDYQRRDNERWRRERDRGRYERDYRRR